MPQFDKQHAARRRARRVVRGRWVADIGAGGIIAVLIREDAIQHNEFLATAMRVG